MDFRTYLMPQLCLLLLNNIYFLQFLNESENEIKMLQKLALVQRKGHTKIIPSEFFECSQVFSLLAYMQALKNHGRI
jgi:hypothetical protein